MVRSTLGSLSVNIVTTRLATLAATIRSALGSLSVIIVTTRLGALSGTRVALAGLSTFAVVIIATRLGALSGALSRALSGALSAAGIAGMRATEKSSKVGIGLFEVGSHVNHFAKSMFLRSSERVLSEGDLTECHDGKRSDQAKTNHGVCYCCRMYEVA
jgi:hypothetical protein